MRLPPLLWYYNGLKYPSAAMCPGLCLWHTQQRPADLLPPHLLSTLTKSNHPYLSLANRVPSSQAPRWAQ